MIMRMFYIIFFVLLHQNILHSLMDKGMDYVYVEYAVQKTQNLGIGSCIGKSENYCSEQVENSICNRLKNECFCKKGYVAIREEDRVTCKTLLTNLKCRVDSDCMHINRSTCHPGAGQCACPGNTVYSIELHACRSRFSEDQNPFCLTCQQLNGVCFKYDNGDNTSVSFKYKTEFIGCACSRNYATSITNYKKFSDLCRTTLSDIGEFCDNKQYFCQSKYAECRTINEENSSHRLCHCASDKVPVYQSHLHYFECFPKLSKTHPNCLSCHNLNGHCYDMNNDDIGDGCICPSRLSSETSNLDFQSNLQLCKTNTVHEQCSNGYLSICYQPHTEPPYEHLSHDLESNISTVNLVNRNDDKCNLQKIASYNKYCIRIDLLDFSYNCGVQMHKLKFGKLLYQATLEVRLDRNIKQPSKDLVIPVSCISDHFQREIKNQSENLSSVIKIPEANILNLGLQILDKFNKEVFSLVEGSEIKFDLSLVDSQGKFRGMRVEECYTSNHSTVIHEKKSNYGDKIISKGCPIFSNGFFAPFKTFVSPGIHLQSDLFQVFRHGNLHSIFYKCFIKVCVDVKDCENVKCYNQELKYQSEDKQHLKNNSKSVIFKRWTHIEVQKLQGYKNTKPGTDNSVCHHVVCLSASQTVLIALLLLFLLLMVIVLLIFYSRGKALSNSQCQQILTPSYFNSTNTNSKPKQSVLSSENNSMLSFRNSQTTTIQRPSKGVPYLDTYLSLTPQFSYTVDSGRDTELNSYSNNNFDLQRNAYARQISPSRGTNDRKSLRTSEFANLSEQNNPTSSLDYVEPCYISIRRSNISQPVSVHHQINPTNITQCSCGSKECEYQPFILTPSSS